jgi:hypothetical protein
MEVLGNLSCKEQGPPLFPGEAYLAAGQGRAATVEFHKILDHRSIVWNCWTGALARLRVAHANALVARTSQGADADAEAFMDFGGDRILLEEGRC